MVLAVFLASCAAQKHASAAECQKSHRQDKRQGLHPGLFSRARVDSIENSPADTRKTGPKCESQARPNRSGATATWLGPLCQTLPACYIDAIRVGCTRMPA